MHSVQNFRAKRQRVFLVGDALFSFAIFVGAGALCFVIGIFDEDKNYVSMIFILAVFLVARFTHSYFYGIAVSVASVLAVNYAFTYPYFKFNFSIAGYPIAMLCMLAVSLITSALTSQAKQSQTIKIEAEKEKTRSNLLRAVSHDLRTPLTSILGATSAIIENDDTIAKEERIALLGEVREEAQWLIRMVENLLAITRIDGETRAKIVKNPEAVEELVSEAVTKFKNRFPERNVAVKVPREVLFVPVDAVLVEQVIINLLENAVLHGKTADKIELLVTLKGDDAVFTVRDNGVGIEQDVLPKIFDGYFKQSYESVGDSKRNMGIGLSVCNTIIRAHNGTMQARNLDSKGAEFSFTLPIKEESNERQAQYSYSGR